MKKVDEKNFVIFKAHNILGIGNEGFNDYLFNLGETMEFKIYDLASLLFAIRLRALAFRNKNCRIIDRMLEPEVIKDSTFDEVDLILKKAIGNEDLIKIEKEKYSSYITRYLQEIAEELDFGIS